MSDAVQITLAGGQTVVVELLADPGSHQSVQARISGPAGGPGQTIVIDDGVNTLPAIEDFRNLDAVALTGGGFAVAYDDEIWNQSSGIGQDRLTVISFDAAGAMLGSFRTITDSDLSIPDDAYPHLTALANGGFAATAQNIHGLFGEGPAANVEFYDDHAARLGGVHLSGSAYPPAVTDSTQGVIVTFQTAAGQMREVVGTDGHVIVPAAGVDTIGGTSGDDVLNGGPGPDFLVGGAGDDTLAGGPGYDSLDGGPGSDLFVFRPDGSVDQVAGFDPAHDKLTVIDPTSPSGGFAAVLALDLRSHVLSWDGDGDEGPGAPVPIAVLPGLKGLNYGEVGDPLWPRTLRVTNLDGSHTDLSQWRSTSVFRSQTSSYDPQGRLFLRESTTWQNTHSTEWFDASGTQPWAHLVASYDLVGSLTRYQTLLDDSTLIDWRFDPHNQEDWQREIYVYKGAAPNVRLATITRVMDDGSYTVTWDDNPSQHPWSSLVAAYDTSGALTNYNVTYDNGEQVLWSFDPHNTEPLNWKHEDYDSAGRLTQIGFVYDDGSSKIAHFDVDNSQPWQMIADVFDPAGRQTGHWIYFDDGTIVV